jgi:hypothetical protein
MDLRAGMSRIRLINWTVNLIETSWTQPVAITTSRSMVCVAQVRSVVCSAADDAVAVDFGAHVVCVRGLFVEYLMGGFCCMLFWVYVFG